MELFAANKQWSTRPEDERFTSLEALYDATKAYANVAIEKADVPVSTLSALAVGDDVQLVGRKGVPARLTHWAFGQLSARVGAPAGYLRSLPPALAAENINHGPTRMQESAGNVNLLFHADAGAIIVRAMTGDRYERIWNYEIAERLLEMQSRGWEPARPDVRVQDDRLPLYASDHDLFAFVRSANHTIREAGNASGLQRGLIVENSEVGASALKMTRFYYREMCGNHIIWGAEDVISLSLRHVGKIRDRISTWDASIKRYMDASASDDEAKIAAAQSKRIAATKDEVLDALFGMKTGIARKTIEAGYEAVKPDEDGDPRTVWGYVQGLTRHSQTLPHGDARTALDRAAGQLIDAF